MTPNDDFYYKKNSHFAIDQGSLIKCYYPLIGQNAFALYYYFHEFNDGGRNRFKVSQVLNHLMISPDVFSKSLDRLMGVGLLKLYEASSEQAHYIELKPTLPIHTFLQNAVYRNMLEDKIGDYATSQLMEQNEIGLKEVTKSFSEIFKVRPQGVETAPKPKPEAQSTTFDANQLKQLMAREGLVFDNEHKDLPALFSLADQYKLTWYDCYQLARKTAIKNKVNVERLTTLLSSQQTIQPGSQDFSHKEQVVISEVKSDRPENFLAKLKSVSKAVVTNDELRLIGDLQIRGFLDEVINVLILFSTNRVDSINLNRNYIEKVANSFLANEIKTAEQAMVYLRALNQKPQKKTAPKKKQTGNNPTWSDPNYVNETSDQRKKELEEMRRRTLEKLNGRGE